MNDTSSIEVSFDQRYLYFDFYQSFASVTVLISDANNNVVLHKIYNNPQFEMIQLDSFAESAYKIELLANGGLMWGWFLIQHEE
jgi:hypothetical protein